MPWVISLISVCVAIASVWMNKRMAYRQAFFDRKAQAYELFFEAFSTLPLTSSTPQSAPRWQMRRIVRIFLVLAKLRKV